MQRFSFVRLQMLTFLKVSYYQTILYEYSSLTCLSVLWHVTSCSLCQKSLMMLL